MKFDQEEDEVQIQETPYILHQNPDGSMTVQFICPEDVERVQGTYLPSQDPNPSAFITIDERPSRFISADCLTPSQFLLTLTSTNQLITADSTEIFLSKQHVTGDEGVFPGTPNITSLPEFKECPQATIHDRTNIPQTTTYEDNDRKPFQDTIRQQIIQDKSYCANCFSKLISSNCQSKKFKDYLYDYKPNDSENVPPRKNISQVTVQESMEIMFDLTYKVTLSEFCLEDDYTFCLECTNSLAKLHGFFMDFIQSSRSPSFMKAIFCDIKIPDGESFKDTNPLLEFDNGTDDKTESKPKSNKIVESAVCRKPMLCAKETTFESSNIDVSTILPKSKTPATRRSTRLRTIPPKLINYAEQNNGVNEFSQKFSSIHNSDPDDESEKIIQENSIGMEKEEHVTKRRDRLQNMKNRFQASVCLVRLHQTQKFASPNEPGSVSYNTLTKHEPQHVSDIGQEFKPESIASYPEINVHDDTIGLPGDSDYKGIATDDFKPSAQFIRTEEDPSPTAEVSRRMKTSWARLSRQKAIQCTKCCAKFIRKSHYVDHCPVHDGGGWTSPKCNGIFNSAKNLNRHLGLFHSSRGNVNKKQTSRPFECHLCRQVFTRNRHLQDHFSGKHHIDLEAMLGEFPCAICPSKVYYSDRALQAHCKRKHSVRILEKKHGCDECEMKFFKKSDLENHKTTHTNIRRFICEICGFACKRRQDLTRHRKMVHLKETRYNCGICDKGFLNLWQVKSHLLTHDERKTFPCMEPGCGKSFRCSNNLRQHKNTHEGLKHVCQYCGESYTRISYLKKHVELNHGEGSRNTTKVGINRKPTKTFKLMDTTIEVIEPDALDLDFDTPPTNAQTEQIIVHGIDESCGDFIMEYVIS